MLLWHHLFFNRSENYELFQSVFYYNNIPIECCVADVFKICVAVFLLLSGYGLYKSWKSYENRLNTNNHQNQMIFVKNHLLKLMFGYWFIYLIFVPMGAFFGKPFWEVYQGNILYGFIDFLGLSNLFSTPTMNATWWFMGTIIVYYILFPVFIKVFSYSKEMLVAIAALVLVLPIPNIGELKTWLLPFVIGMCSADCNMFTRLDDRLGNTLIRWLVALSFLVVATVFYRGNSKSAVFLASVIIIASCSVLSRIPILNKVLEIFGIYSSGIFMFHTFIFSYYFKEFIYGFKYSFLIYFVLVAICLFIAFVIEKIKHIIHLDRLLLICTK
jgi:peptidoglycan/LPS O-acetylase OafA/YrhL